MAEVAQELQHLQLPWEQPQQGLADNRDNMSNKEPLHKCCEEDNDAIKGTAIEATAAKIVEGNKELWSLPIERPQLGPAVDSELIRLTSTFNRSRMGLNKLLQVSSTS